MNDPVRGSLPIGDVKIRFVDRGTDGLVAWASCVVGGAIRLDNIGIRRGDRGFYLTFPRKETAGGEKHPYFHPVDQEAAQALQDAILRRLAALAAAAATPGAQGQ